MGTKICEAEQYVNDLKQQIESGQIQFRGNPRLLPPDPFYSAGCINQHRLGKGEEFVNTEEALRLVLRPAVFVWAPTFLFSGQEMFCPFCRATTSSFHWLPHRDLHGFGAPSIYITTEHI